MKTKYFKKVSLSEDGIQWLKTLAILPKDSIEKIMKWFEARKEYPRYDDTEIIEVSKLTDLSGKETNHSLSILRLFIDRIIDNDENVKDFYGDIKKLEIVESDIGYVGLDIVFSHLPAIIESFRIFRRRELTESYGAPTLTGSSMSAFIKPVYPKKFEYGEDVLEKYEPTPLVYSVMAMIELQKSDCEHVFSFQFNSNNFDRFLNDLLALQAEMAQMEKEAQKLSENLK